ncbi:MAG: hypothetical protein ACKO96_18795 [Flammeovirgaceae bacterium]
MRCSINNNDYEIKGFESNPALILPVAFGNLSISDLLDKSDSINIKVKPDGLVYLNYDQSLISKDIRNLIDIPSINNKSVELPIPAGNYPANIPDYTLNIPNETIDMGIAPEQLTEIGFKNGTISYEASLTPANPNFVYEVHISIPEFISSSGSKLSQQVTAKGNVPLAGYTFKSANANKFTVALSVVIKKNALPVTIAPNTKVNFNFSITGLDFTYIKGFFGDQIATAPLETIDIQAFNNSLQNNANVSFAAPTIDFLVTTDYGVPLELDFPVLEASKPGATLAMQTSPVNPISLNAPVSLGGSATTAIQVTNAKQLLSFAPTQLKYMVRGHINQGLTTGINFMADTSKMRVKMHVEVPLYGNAYNIILTDTASIDLGEIDQTKIDSASLKVNAINELPLDASLQFVLTDDRYVFIDSLLTTSQSKIIKGSSVDSNGDLLSVSRVNKSILLQQDKISKIFKARKIIITAKLNTSKNSAGELIDVKFKSQYKININVGLKTTLKLKANF